MRLIDADALLDEIRKSKDGHNHADQEILMNHHMEHDAFMDLVDAAPTIEAMPVVYGRWIVEHWSSGYIKRCFCSICGDSPKDAYRPDNYCPNCLAKMDGGNEVELLEIVKE